MTTPAPFKLTAIDLCAGAGGLSLGLVRAGFDVLGVELDAIAADMHRRYVGPCVEADISAWSPPASVDLVCGGVPCQSFSIAGKRGGTREARGQLYSALIRIGVEANARALMIENVQGMKTWRDAERRGVVPIIEAEMRAAGYDTAHLVLNAVHYGVPQKRRRLIIVGFRSLGSGRHRPLERGSCNGPGDMFAAPWVTVRQALELGGAFGTGRKESAGWNGMRFVDVDAPGWTVGAGTGPDLLSPLDSPSPTVCSDTQLAAELAAAGLLDHDRQQRGAVRLTPEQCARLQDFPPDWQWPSKKKDAHRLIGNAVPPGLAYAIGRSIRTALDADT